MKKVYTVPTLRTIDMFEEEGILVLSDGSNYDLDPNEEGEDQLSNGKNFWDREGIWK